MQENKLEVLFQAYRDEEPKFDEDYLSQKVLSHVRVNEKQSAEYELYELRRGIAYENFKAGFKCALSLLKD